MQYRKLGKTGLKISELSYGSWITFGNQLDEKGASEIMSVAFDQGINFFDNAEAYKQGPVSYTHLPLPTTPYV